MRVEAKTVFVAAIRFVVSAVLAMFILAMPFALLVAGSEEVTLWQVVALYLACALVGLLEVLMYLRRKRQAERDGSGHIEEVGPTDSL